MDPRQTGLAPSFLSTHFAFWRWQSCQPFRTGLFWALATGPTSTAPSQYNERVRCSADSYLEELKAEGARVRGTSLGNFESSSSVFGGGKLTLGCSQVVS